MKNGYLLLGLFLLVFNIASSQQIDLEGKVTNAFDIEGIHILNKTSKYNTVTNEFGEFIIRIQVQDTIIFSSIKYQIKELIITEDIYHKKKININLNELVNELDEVLIGNTLTGDLFTDLKNIKVEETFNFDDVGIPGFKGEPEEKIVPLAAAAFPLNVNIEALYKHIGGYYKKLKIQRKWTKENLTVAEIIDYYGFKFFEDAYRIPNNKLYDFLLFCIETTTLNLDYNRQNFAGVLQIFNEKSKIYVPRIK
ncbi:carboxypeptidase-like regulatory domain-containing protein [Flavobacteriaceae bacterium]|jgi:hypothetical protein|nr:carboxypeptidase-like regulatory domain-containing protein [Flavobacteriaceae bacterium]MDA9341360.1 carboxypeptidase-like regulatory domain-containing protein [Flavobacteriaceae bacterium]MDB9912764.1 carboxypeptidase-like regulatory domain-containing protein [Flavobacteriaceae bacterium]MDC0539061.1 carboxypeptidase-like regulatory domain-containing protein [Flavobacteriaceae bacterium]